jgi:hypothetical protein
MFRAIEKIQSEQDTSLSETIRQLLDEALQARKKN